MTSSQAEMMDLLLKAYALEQGIGVTSDPAQALMLWEKAAAAGSTYAKGRGSRLQMQEKEKEKEKEKADKTATVQPENIGQGRKALIMDDAEDSTVILKAFLQKWGFVPVVATDGVDGLERTLAHPDIQLMLIDLQMPNMNGFEFISTLRQQKAFGDIPIIIVTAFTNKKLIDKGRSLKVQGWISKPINQDLLAKTIQRLFQEKGAA